MELVTTFSPPTTTGAGELVCQTADESRLVVDSKVKSIVLVGHVKIKFVPETQIVNCGANERLYTVPVPNRPPP